MPKKNQVAFVRPADPKFLRLMKEQIGYSDGPTIEAKVMFLQYRLIVFNYILRGNMSFNTILAPKA